MTYDEPPRVQSLLPLLKSRLNAAGYAIFPRLAAGIRSEQLAAEIGQVVTSRSGAIVQQLTPKALSTPNTYSGNFGLGRFPFHTDLAHWPVPPRYLFLRCVKGYLSAPTLLLDGFALVAQIGSEMMRRALTKPRRPQSGRMPFLRLYEHRAEVGMIRWDQVYLKPASRIGELAFEKVREHLQIMEPTTAVMVDDGDIVVIDNWRMLHSRPAISEDQHDRHLERIYLRRLT